MLDDLFEEVEMWQVGLTYLFAMVLVLIMFKSLKGHEMGLNVIELLIIAVVLLPISYVITRHLANKD